MRQLYEYNKQVNKTFCKIRLEMRLTKPKNKNKKGKKHLIYHYK